MTCIVLIFLVCMFGTCSHLEFIAIGGSESLRMTSASISFDFTVSFSQKELSTTASVFFNSRYVVLPLYSFKFKVMLTFVFHSCQILQSSFCLFHDGNRQWHTSHWYHSTLLSLTNGKCIVTSLSFGRVLLKLIVSCNAGREPLFLIKMCYIYCEYSC